MGFIVYRSFQRNYWLPAHRRYSICPDREALMTPEAGFLDDILDHPDDDTPRLVYADWLTDRGGRDDQARAELIRIQCQQARPARENGSLRPWFRLRNVELLQEFAS